MARKLCVKFGSLKSPTRVKLFTLPEVGEQCDFLVLRNLLHQEMLFDMSIIDLGGSKQTPVEDVIISQFDETFGMAIDITSKTVLRDGATDIVVNLRAQDYVLISTDDNGQNLEKSQSLSSENGQNLGSK